jgi:hypothetical protein
MTSFVKKLVKWCKQWDNKFKFIKKILGKLAKFLWTKLKILELHQNKFENSQIWKQYSHHYFPQWNLQNDKKKIKILEFQNTKSPRVTQPPWLHPNSSSSQLLNLL